MTFYRKESIEKLFTGYINIIGNPQSQYRREAAEQISKALAELDAQGLSFEELISGEDAQVLTMTTAAGLENFKRFIRDFQVSGYNDTEDMSDIVDEKMRIAEWVREHKRELIV